MKLFQYLKSARQSRVYIFFLGLASLVWFLIRVIPKPSRAAYPCMRVAAPMISAFLLYLIGLTSSVWFLKKSNRTLLLSRCFAFFTFLALPFFSFSDTPNSSQVLVEPDYYVPNNPVGIPQGIYPGRVIWVHDPMATNENVKNTPGDYWYMDKNSDQKVIEDMLDRSLREISGRESTEEAWEAIFRHFNRIHGEGERGYQEGESIAVKINLTNSYNGSLPSGRMDATPQLILALLKHLVEVVGIPQSEIWVGDSYRTFRNEYWDKCHPVYPDIHYMDGLGYSGREKTQPSGQVLKFSDKINPNTGQENTSSLPLHFVDADYLINVPCLKSHEAGGITLAAKNHQGSVLEEGTDPEDQFAAFMHYSLPSFNQTMGSYRHLVDYMGHKDLGGKTLLYIVDGLWAGRESSGWLEKWNMDPFNVDWPSSIFVSMDPVAIESVCFDFLLAEYLDKDESIRHPYLLGTDDYLWQAADSNYWPEGLRYDPEGDGSFLSSLGVYEHWNNSIEKAYSRNLGTGDGIELRSLRSAVSAPKKQPGVDFQLFPNPFSENLYFLLKDRPGGVRVTIYDLQGKTVLTRTSPGSFLWDGTLPDGARINPGVYIFSVTDNLSGERLLSEKISYLKN